MLQKLKLSKGLVFVFLLCFAYWAYLILNSQMEVEFDAIEYEQLGKMIYQQGWQEYFRTGPNREPLYPFTIAVSMNVAQGLGVSYQMVQKSLQIGILFLTQLILLAFMTRMKVNHVVKIFVLLYFGFSPAMVNSALSLYSEIAAYPFVLGIVWFSCRAWHNIHLSGYKKVLLSSILTAASFTFASLAKGIFQYVYVFFFLTFAYAALRSFLKKNWMQCRVAVIYIALTTFFFGSAMMGYRLLNKTYNGKFDFTNRYDNLLFGNAAKRVDKVDFQLFLAHLASIPGGGVCRKFFSEEQCQYCEFFYADRYRSQLLEERLKGIAREERQSKTVQLALTEMAKNPAQYVILTSVESLKMAFWESSQIGFVAYPSFLEKLFASGIFRYGIRFAVSFLTYVSLFTVLVRTIRRRKMLLDFLAQDHARLQIGFFLLVVIIPFSGLYAMYSILTRFAFPIVPLYHLCIAYCLNEFVEAFYPVSNEKVF